MSFLFILFSRILNPSEQPGEFLHGAFLLLKSSGGDFIPFLSIFLLLQDDLRHLHFLLDKNN